MDLTVWRNRWKHIPSGPGVYLFKDSGGNILYVGKASNLRHRVRSYFQSPSGKDLKTSTLLEQAADWDTIVTSTEKEALLLEDNLIKEHHPRFNIKFRDDKLYPSLRFSWDDEFPTLSIVRRVRNDGALYFGPYPSAISLRETLKMIRKIFPIRTSLDSPFSRRLPPWQKIDPGRYRETVTQVRMFLEGKNDALLADLRKKMGEAAERMNFEAAARIRDQVEHIRKVVEKQRIISRDHVDRDVIGFSRREEGVAVYLLFLRKGKLLGGKGFALQPSDLPEGEILESFLQQYYGMGNFIPRQILLPAHLPDTALIEHWLGERKKERVRILVPSRGERRRLSDLARKNAAQFVILPDLEPGPAKLLSDLRDSLRLSRIPRRIEAFDISNIGGVYAVGSMVTFRDGKPEKEGYRRFRIRTVTGADDTGMMREVFRRRYKRALAEKALPDLILVDGGRGQLNAALEVLQELQVEGVDIISLAKERTIEGPGPFESEKTEEKIFHPQLPDPFVLGRHSPLLRFLDRVRDEAHRFAITYHKVLRGKGAIQSVFGDIPGIGPGRQRDLLEFFGTAEKVGKAEVADLLRVPGMNRRAAQAIYQFFHPAQ